MTLISEERVKIRQEKVVPMLEEFKTIVDDKLKNESEYHALFIKAVKYTINQWEYLTAYTQNGD